MEAFMRKEKYMYKNDVYKSFKKKTKHHDSKQKNNHSLLTLITKLGITAQKMFKAPVFWIIISLILVILVLPSLIVNPFSKSVHKQIANESQTEQLRIETIDDDLALSVAVMRTESEKVEQIPLETYVSRVVASEMPAEFELEALKAQALAARTFIVNHLLHKDEKKVDGEESDVLDTVQHQVYNNEEELRKTLEAD